MTYSNTTAPTPWAVRATGNMTLSVVAATGEQIVRLDLLVSGAMRAGGQWMGAGAGVEQPRAVGVDPSVGR